MNSENRTNMVVTGQQIGLLGGPLYTTYKVLGAVFHARQLKGKAVYWLETNDADFNEINHIDYLDLNGELRRLTWEINSQGYSCGYIPVDQSLLDVLETFFSTLRQTDFTPALKEMVFECYQRDRTLAEASELLAKELFGAYDIHFFSPFEADFRSFSQVILRREAEHTPNGEQCNCFCMMGKQRKAIFKANDQFLLREGNKIDLDKYDLVPNVKTRSVCQDAYFNTHTYVAGPGEVKYLSELTPVFDFHNVKPAKVQPRMSVYLIEPRVKRLMSRNELDLQPIIDMNREDLIKHVLKNKTLLDFSQILKTSNDYTAEYLNQLETLGFNPPDIKKMGKMCRQEIKKLLGQLRAKEKEKHQRLLLDVGALSDNLKPLGKKQDRIFNIFYYMNLFGGKEFINRIFNEYHPDKEIMEI